MHIGWTKILPVGFRHHRFHAFLSVWACPCPLPYIRYKKETAPLQVYIFGGQWRCSVGLFSPEQRRHRRRLSHQWFSSMVIVSAPEIAAMEGTKDLHPVENSERAAARLRHLHKGRWAGETVQISWWGILRLSAGRMGMWASICSPRKTAGRIPLPGWSWQHHVSQNSDTIPEVGLQPDYPVPLSR